MMQPGKAAGITQMLVKGTGLLFTRIGLSSVLPLTGSGCFRYISSLSGWNNVNYNSQQPPSLQLGGVRYVRWEKKKHFKKIDWRDSRMDPEGINHEGFTYFPRFPEEKDPPIEPTKLFMVKRVRSCYGCPYWEKRWIRRLGLEYRSSVAIVKNSPTSNRMLYHVKHLVEVTPITLPYGMPDSPENGFLKQSGEFVSYNVLAQHEENLKIEDAEKYTADYFSKTMDSKTMSRRLKRRWYSRIDAFS